MSEIEAELQNLFERANDDIRKGDVALKVTKAIKDTATRFIKLSKRMYDISKLFETEFGVSVDVIALRALLLFARSCFIASHVLFSTDYLRLRSHPSFVSRMSSLPRRAAHKVYKRLFRREKFLYGHEQKEYEDKKLAFVKNGKGRDHQEELINAGVGLKDIGTRLLLIARASGLVEDMPKLKVEKIDLTLDQASADLMLCLSVLKTYYAAVKEKLDEVDDLHEKGLLNKDEVDYDECLIPLLKTMKMSSRKILRGDIDERKKKTKVLDVTNSKGDVEEATRYLICLERALLEKKK